MMLALVTFEVFTPGQFCLLRFIEREREGQARLENKVLCLCNGCNHIMSTYCISIIETSNIGGSKSKQTRSLVFGATVQLE
jgi:hypothetical protein